MTVLVQSHNDPDGKFKDCHTEPYSKKSAITTADCIRSQREQNGCCTIVSPVRIQSKVKKMVCPESKLSWSWSLSRLKFVDSAAMVTAAVPACPLVLVYSFMCAKTYFHNDFCIPITLLYLHSLYKNQTFLLIPWGPPGVCSSRGPWYSKKPYQRLI